MRRAGARGRRRWRPDRCHNRNFAGSEHFRRNAEEARAAADVRETAARLNGLLHQAENHLGSGVVAVAEVVPRVEIEADAARGHRPGVSQGGARYQRSPARNGSHWLCQASFQFFSMPELESDGVIADVVVDRILVRTDVVEQLGLLEAVGFAAYGRVPGRSISHIGGSRCRHHCRAREAACLAWRAAGGTRAGFPAGPCVTLAMFT